MGVGQLLHIHQGGRGSHGQNSGEHGDGQLHGRAAPAKKSKCGSRPGAQPARTADAKAGDWLGTRRASVRCHWFIQTNQWRRRMIVGSTSPLAEPLSCRPPLCFGVPEVVREGDMSEPAASEMVQLTLADAGGQVRAARHEAHCALAAAPRLRRTICSRCPLHRGSSGTAPRTCQSLRRGRRTACLTGIMAPRAFWREWAAWRGLRRRCTGVCAFVLAPRACGCCGC